MGNDGFAEGYGKKNRNRIKKKPDVQRPTYPVEQNGGYQEGYTDYKYVQTPKENLSPIEVIIEPIQPQFPVQGTGKLVFQTVTPLNTINNGDLFTNQTFLYQPLTSSYIFLAVNGMALFPANGQSQVAIQAWYATDSTGTIIRSQGTFQIGDLFHWTGSIAGWQIETTDNVQLIYQIM